MNKRAILMWGDDTPSQDIQNKISVLKRNGIEYIYLVSCGDAKHFENEPGVIRIHNRQCVGSANALRRALHYIKGLNIQDQYGIYLIYSTAHIDDRLMTRVSQLTTISDTQRVDMFMLVRVTDKAYSKKYITNLNGFVTHSKVAIRGNQEFGIFFICNPMLIELAHGEEEKISNLIDGMCKQNKKIFAITNGCC